MKKEAAKAYAYLAMVRSDIDQLEENGSEKESYERAKDHARADA